MKFETHMGKLWKTYGTTMETVGGTGKHVNSCEHIKSMGKITYILCSC